MAIITHPAEVDLEFKGAVNVRGVLTASGGGPHDKTLYDDANRRKSAYVQHRCPQSSRQLEGTAVVARTEPIYVATGAGTIESFRCHVPVAPVGGTTGFTVDLEKSTGGGAYASILSAVITVNDSNTADRETEVGALSANSFVAGDAFRVVWALVGSGGTQAQGALAQADFIEHG